MYHTLSHIIQIYPLTHLHSLPDPIKPKHFYPIQIHLPTPSTGYIHALTLPSHSETPTHSLTYTHTHTHTHTHNLAPPLLITIIKNTYLPHTP